MKQGRTLRNSKPQSEASEEIFHLLFHDHPLPMWVIDLETLAFLDVNRAAVEKYGYAREEFLTMNLKDIRPPEDRAPLPDDRESLRRELQHSGEWRHRLRDGRIIDVEINSHALSYQGRKAALAMSQDITERKRADDALRESEAKLRAMFESSRDAIGVSKKGIHILANPSYLKLFGFENNQSIVGTSIIDSIAPSYRQQMIQNVQRRAAGEPVAKFYEARGMKVGGTEFDAEFNVSTYELNGEIYSVATIRDITERKQAEEALRESEERFRQLSEAALEGIAITEKGVLLDGNTRLAAMLGSELGEIIGRPVSDFIAPDSRTLVLKHIAEDYEGGYEHLLLRKDGSTIPVESHARTVIWNGRTARVTALLDLSTRKLVEEQLHKLSLAVDQSPASIVITDTRGNIEYVNPKFTRVTGYTSEEALGENPRILKSGETSPGEYEKLWKTITAGREWRGEFHNRKKNGELFWETASISPVKNKDNVITNYVAVKEDITDRKNAERELTLMAQTVASARDCIYITDLENRLLFVNDAFRATYGYATEELLGEDISIVRSPGAPAAAIDPIFHDTLSGGWHGEILNRRKDGSDFPVELWTSVVRDEAGVPMALVGVARDIADRKMAEEHLRRSEEEFRLIAENVADMIAVVDLDGRRIYNNPSYRAILGDPESLKGTDGFQEIHPDDQERVKQVFQESVRTGIGQRIEYRFLLKDGSVRSIDSKGSVIRDAQGRISQVIVVSRDVTEEKRLAAQFLRSQRMESIGTLAGGIAHDLNNVLAPIMMAIEILRSKTPDPAGQRVINTIETSAKRGADIVRQVLAFGRGVKGDRILVQLKHVINEVVKIAGETFPRSIEINADIRRNLWTVSADPTQMHQVLLNMLLNARDAMPGGGTLTISAENIILDAKFSRMHPEAKPGAYVSMAISDTGTGIPSDIREKIFEPFFTTKEIGMGTGLGLSTTLAIVKSHEGFINLQSESGKGTTFRIYIPATGTRSGEAAADEAMDLPMGKGELVLIIDDEAAIREITKETLQAHGYNAITASDGEKGVAAFSENKENISIVITDIMMPVMDGADAILALRRIKPDVKIISTSGLTGKGQIASPPDSNVQAFLTKPYTAEKLLKALAVALG